MTDAIGQASSPAVQALLNTTMDNFISAWQTGDWAPFTAALSEDFIFQFPAGPLMGRHTGRDGYQRIVGFANAMIHNRMTEIDQGPRIFAGDWLVTTFRSIGVFNGQPYKGVEAIFLRAAGGKIVEYREYLGEIPPMS